MQAYIISSLKKDMPAMFGKEAKKKELIKNLDALYAQLQREHKINAGDFPDLEKMKKDLVHLDFAKFRGFDRVLYYYIYFLMFPIISIRLPGQENTL